MELPFEHDAAELIEACARALGSAEPYLEPAGRTARTRTGEDAAGAGARPELWEEEMQASARIGPDEAEQIFFRDLPATPGADLDAEALSRAFERDARRYE